MARTNFLPGADAPAKGVSWSCPTAGVHLAFAWANDSWSRRRRWRWSACCCRQRPRWPRPAISIPPSGPGRRVHRYHGWVGGTTADQLYSLALQEDSRIVAAGNCSVGNVNIDARTEFCLTRYEADGTLDDSFGTNGVVSTWVMQNTTSRQADGNGGSRNFANNTNVTPALAIQPDGKIVIAGTCYFTGFNMDFCLVRYLPDGTLDTTFGPFCTPHSVDPTLVGCSGLFEVPGEVVTDVASGPITVLPDNVMDIALQPDGHIVVVGWCQVDLHPAPCFARYGSNGELVSSGIAPVGDVDGKAMAVVVQSDGKVLVAGPDADTTTGSTGRVTRFSQDMVVDPTFGSGGSALIAGTGLVLTSMAIQPDGRIVVGGLCGGGGGCIARLDSDGNLDGSFGIDGQVSGFQSRGVLLDVAVASDGKIVAGGNCEGTSEMCVGRFTAGGSPDPTFGDSSGFARPGPWARRFPRRCRRWSSMARIVR